MTKPQFHPLRVASVEELTDDSVAISFVVPPELADDYRFVHGQHLTIRGDDGERRSFSICATPSSGVLRIGVKKGGCAGMEYTMQKVAAPDAKDEHIEEKGVSVFVDPSAVLFLLGTVMDFETTKLRSGFVFRNPNEVSACGCGESVMLKPAEMPGAAAAS